MEDEKPSKALWLLSLPLTPILLGAAAVGGGVAAMANGPVWLGALSAWAIAAAATTAVIGLRSSWGYAVGIVTVASLVGFGGLALLGGLIALVIFGLFLAVCGGMR